MISTSSHNDWQSNKYKTFSISGNRGKDANYQGKCYPDLAPKLVTLTASKTPAFRILGA